MLTNKYETWIVISKLKYRLTINSFIYELTMNWKKCSCPFRLKQNSLWSEVGDAIGKMCPGQSTKRQKSVYAN